MITFHKTSFIITIFLCRIEGTREKETGGKAEEIFYNRLEVLVHYFIM